MSTWLQNTQRYGHPSWGIKIGAINSLFFFTLSKQRITSFCLIKIFPVPFTVLLDSKKSDLCDLVKSDSSKIGIRIPNNKFCIDLLKKYKKPIVTTSVNIHNQKALNNIDEIDDIFFNINIYKGLVKENSRGSTILDFTYNPPKIIREGDGTYKKWNYLNEL